MKLAILLLTSLTLHAATYYVSPSGNDSSSGSASAPWRTFSRAANVAAAGDDVIFNDGTYGREAKVSPAYVVTLGRSGSAGRPITFKAANRLGAVLDSQNTSLDANCNGAAAYVNLVNSSYIVIQGFDITRGCLEGIHSNDSAHHITFRNNRFHHIANHISVGGPGLDGIYMNPSQTDFLFDGNEFDHIGRVNMTNNDHGIYFAAKNVTIVNCVFHDNQRGWGIQLADGATNALIANNTFIGGTEGGGYGQVMLWGTNTNVTFRNNIFYQPQQVAIARWEATLAGSNYFDRNIVYGVNSVIGDASNLTIGVNQMGVDPRMSVSDFKLQSGSPAIGSGLKLAQAATDFYGATRVTADIGAVAFASATPVPPPLPPPPTAPTLSGITVDQITGTTFRLSWISAGVATSMIISVK